jgi:hypothetical protein
MLEKPRDTYDTALIESWKADMEGMLIFVCRFSFWPCPVSERVQSGLFSASLTAFLIESYKILQLDSGDLTVAALMQVSQQLAVIASDRTFVLQPPLPFNPTTASLWCNALWLINLSLSLTCALLATLVDQCAREFLHKTEIRPSPVRRARIFSFLYYGLQHFRMHTIVDAIPFLFHASLLLFFAGLVAFLLPANHIMCIALVIVLLLDAALPVIRLDRPYRTPLSAGKPPDLLPHNSAIWAIRYLRYYTLGWAHNELSNMHRSRDPSTLFRGTSPSAFSALLANRLRYPDRD